MNEFNFPRPTILAAALLLQLSHLSLHSHAAPGDLDLSFNPGSGLNDEVKAIALQPDGKLLIGGRFTIVKGLIRFSLARLNPDGSGDASFDAGTNADTYISAIAVQPDGKVIFTREYANLAGEPAGDKVVRLNTDGSVDASFVPAPLANAAPNAFTCMAVQPDGRILVGGYSVAANDFGSLDYHSLLIRLNANGSIDNTFTNDNGTFGGLISCLALQRDGKILIGGGIVTSVNGTDHYNLLRLNPNGSVDMNFNAVEGIIHSVGLQSDGKILLAGYGIGTSTNWNGVGRLNDDGSIDSSFHPGTDANTSLSSLVVQLDGKVICIGGYIYVNGANRNGVVRLNSNGSVDSDFNATTDAPNNAAAVVALTADDRILIGGGFTLVNGTNRERLVRLNSDGTLDASFTPGSTINGGINSVALQADGKVLIGGEFTLAGGAARDRAARLNADGSLDGSFDPGALISSDFYHPKITSVLARADGRVFIGGDFTAVNGKSLARLNADGTLDSTFVPNIGLPGVGFGFVTLALQADGKLLVGGANLGNDAGNGVARLNANGSFDTSFHADTIGTTGADYAVINSVVVQPDRKILAGGYFVRNDVPEFLLTRLNADGSRDTNFSVLTGSVLATSIVLQPDGKMIVGSVAYDNTSGWVARLDSSGIVDQTFNFGSAADGAINSIALQANGKILIGGSFTTVNATSRNRIARLNSDGSLDTSFNPDAGINGIVQSLALQPDGNILIGGEFTTVNGVLRPFVARLFGDAGGPPNLLPTVSIESPANGATFAAPAILTINANASDSDGTIVQVDVYAGDTLIGSDNSAPFEIPWNNVAPGNYILTADAIDNLGAMATSAPVSISVTNAAPLVSISHPSDRAIFAAPATIAISVEASDADGSIAQVDVYAGDTLVGSGNAAPFEITWNNPAAGDYSLTADATDNFGTTSTSAAVNIHVSAPARPAAPSGLTAAAVARKQIDLRWSDLATNELGFKIVRSTNGKPFKQIAKVGPNVTTFSNTGLAAGSKYSYRVRAYNGLGNSPYSRAAAAKTLR
jgi:uncharacterized delta-60 repeat protein